MWLIYTYSSRLLICAAIACPWSISERYGYISLRVQIWTFIMSTITHSGTKRTNNYTPWHRACQTLWRNASKHYWLMFGKHITSIGSLCLWSSRILQSTKNKITLNTTKQLWGDLFNSIPDIISRGWPQYYITKWLSLQIDFRAICQRDEIPVFYWNEYGFELSPWNLLLREIS